MSHYLSRYLIGEALHFLVQQYILISCVVATKRQRNGSQHGFVVATMNYASSMRKLSLDCRANKISDNRMSTIYLRFRAQNL